MERVRVTVGNVGQYIGREIIFKTRGVEIVRRIMGLSRSGKAIVVEHGDLQNRLNIETRNICVL